MVGSGQAGVCQVERAHQIAEEMRVYKERLEKGANTLTEKEVQRLEKKINQLGCSMMRRPSPGHI